MTTPELIALIGEDLTQIDKCLSRPDFPDTDPQWHQLYALRKALDEQQRDLVAEEFQEDSGAYKSITAKIAGASVVLQAVITDIGKVSQTISTVTEIVGLAGQLIKLATA